MSAFAFIVHHKDSRCGARLSTFHTPHGAVAMPAFMPVGSLGTVKGLDVDHLRRTGTQMVLANTYHLALRPGEENVAQLGGLHSFMGWDGPILTDSGGYQVVSLASRAVVSEEGVAFRSHIDGRPWALSPERATGIQERLGSDVAMVLDHAVPLPNNRDVVRDAMLRTVRWAERCRAAATKQDQVQFAIVQGGTDPELRAECARKLVSIDFAGYAIGGLSVGESMLDMLDMLDVTVGLLPADKPRYLMGLGRPQDILQAIRRGIDLFDCVLPTRNGRNGVAFVSEGPLRLRNKQYDCDRRPLEEGCFCPACRHSRGYLRHLFMAGEMLGPILLSVHNLTHFQHLLAGARRAIAEDRFEAYREEKLRKYEGQRTKDEVGGS